MALDLFVVAGPNGAGKSLFSAALTQVELEVFDGDKHITQLRSEFPETGSDQLQNWVNDHPFKEAKENAIKLKKSFAFETNFSADDPLQSAREFKSAEYAAHLIFIGMESIQDCVQRVSFRVKAGGHKVHEDSIKYNFEFGYKNLFKYYNQFDSVVLFDNSIAENNNLKIPEQLISWAPGKLTQVDKKLPKWVKEFIQRLSD